MTLAEARKYAESYNCRIIEKYDNGLIYIVYHKHKGRVGMSKDIDKLKRLIHKSQNMA